MGVHVDETGEHEVTAMVLDRLHVARTRRAGRSEGNDAAVAHHDPLVAPSLPRGLDHNHALESEGLGRRGGARGRQEARHQQSEQKRDGERHGDPPLGTTPHRS
jgi:hypothetical protein